ncbi:MAG: helix-turn-helix transcriptional regulator [Deltaproteobacteria bacterium]|nr:helix-turn-helix transcriptional regulator [Deltaproteobacteria bacterium]
MLNAKDILKRLKTLRIEKALRQEHVAKTLGVSRTTYVRKEQGTIPITTEEWVMLAEAMGKELGYFFSLSGMGDKEAFLLKFYRVLTPDERVDLLSGIDLIFKKAKRKEIVKALEDLVKV